MMIGDYKNRNLKSISLKDLIDNYNVIENTEILDKGLKILDERIKGFIKKLTDIRSAKGFIDSKTLGKNKFKQDELQRFKKESQKEINRIDLVKDTFDYLKYFKKLVRHSKDRVDDIILEMIFLEELKNRLSSQESSFQNTIRDLKRIRGMISERSQSLKDGKKRPRLKRGGISGYTGLRAKWISDYDLNRDEG